MSIRIDAETCVGCNQCVEVCPGSLIALGEDRKAAIRYPRDCWGCMSCVKACRFDAIDFYLGADMGGMGTTLRVHQKDHYMNWIATKRDGSVSTITIDTQESNKY